MLPTFCSRGVCHVPQEKETVTAADMWVNADSYQSRDCNDRDVSCDCGVGGLADNSAISVTSGSNCEESGYYSIGSKDGCSALAIEHSNGAKTSAGGDASDNYPPRLLFVYI